MNREEYYASLQQYQENSLEHHGILGMKWGVRRFQNKDGTYTQAGLKRYREAESKYNDAKASRNKSGMKSAKKEMSDQYDELKYRRKADQGQKLHEKGERITVGNEGREGAMKALSRIGGGAGSLAIVSGGESINRKLDGMRSPLFPMSDKTLNKLTLGSLGVAAASGVIAGGMKLAQKYKNARLRAYYDMSSKDNKIAKAEKVNKNEAIKKEEAKFNSGFLKYIKQPSVFGSKGLANVDDRELIELVAMEYEELTGKKAYK